MKQEINNYHAIVCDYSLNITTDKHSITFNYHQLNDPTRLFTATFHKHIQGSTNPLAARQILQNFRNFHSFLEYIQLYSEDKQRVSINNDGYVTITVFKTRIKTKKAKIIQFDGTKMMSQQECQQQKQIYSDILEVKAQNTFLKQKLYQIQQQYEQQTKELHLLRTHILNSKKQHLSNLKSDAKRLSRYHKHFQHKQNQQTHHNNSSHIAQLQNSITDMSHQLRSLITKLSQNNIQYHPQYQDTIQEELEEDINPAVLQKYGMKHWVVIDTNNKFIPDHYRIEGDVLLKIGIYGSFQILGRDPFPQLGRHYFSLYLQKISYSIFSVGIACQSRRNYATSHQSPDCITYFAKNGTVWQQGFCRGGGPSIPDRVQLRVVVDMIKQTIKWYQEGEEIGSTIIGKNLIGRRLVPYIQLNYPGNKVIFNRRPNFADQLIVKQIGTD